MNKEDTNPPAENTVASSKTHLPREQTYKLIEDFIAENNLDAWWMKDYGGYIALGICTLLPEEEEEKEEEKDASSTEEEDTNPPAAEEQCVFDWTRKGCVDCDD
tara:strand:+ start:1486 stop:1797 length:312 start_codon:yes stop_codon:yes gene_type:complete